MRDPTFQRALDLSRRICRDQEDMSAFTSERTTTEHTYLFQSSLLFSSVLSLGGLPESAAAIPASPPPAGFRRGPPGSGFGFGFDLATDAVAAVTEDRVESEEAGMAVITGAASAVFELDVDAGPNRASSAAAAEAPL